jgi:hypothetical protein
LFTGPKTILFIGIPRTTGGKIIPNRWNNHSVSVEKSFRLRRVQVGGKFHSSGKIVPYDIFSSGILIPCPDTLRGKIVSLYRYH